MDCDATTCAMDFLILAGVKSAALLVGIMYYLVTFLPF